jgi:hypothetical protein
MLFRRWQTRITNDIRAWRARLQKSSSLAERQYGRLRDFSDGLVARLRRIVGGQIACAIGQKGAQLAADQKDLTGKSAVIGGDNRYTEIFKALAQLKVRGKPHPS